MTFVELMIVGQALLWLILVGVFLASGQASIFHPLTVYLGFHGVVFVVRPILVQFFGFDSIWRYMMIDPSEELLLKTLAVSSVAMLVFSVACFAAGKAELRFQTPRSDEFTTAQKQALVVTTLILGPVVLYSIHALLGGGLQGESHGGVFILTGANGYALESQFMAGPLLCSWLAVTRFGWTSRIALVAYIAYRSYMGLTRWTIVLLLVAISAVYAWQKRLRWLPLWSVALAIPIFLLFQTLGKNRDYYKQWLAGEHPPRAEHASSLSKAEELKQKYDGQEFANFDYLCFVVRAVPERTGTYTYGSQYLQIFTEPIPRKLWPGKPVGAPIGFFNLNSYGNFNGLTVSLPGDGWMSGGWVGLVVTMGVVGFVLGRAHALFWRHHRNNLVVLLYLVGLAMLPQWFRDGGISISKFLFWNLSPIIIWAGFSWLFGRRFVPCHSVLLPPGSRVRIISHEG